MIGMNRRMLVKPSCRSAFDYYKFSFFWINAQVHAAGWHIERRIFDGRTCSRIFISKLSGFYQSNYAVRCEKNIKLPHETTD
jgi:hypothetical protein